MTVDEAEQVQEYTTFGITPERNQHLLTWTDGPKFFEHLRQLPEPVRLENLSGYIDSLGFSPQRTAFSPGRAKGSAQVRQITAAVSASTSTSYRHFIGSLSSALACHLRAMPMVRAFPQGSMGRERLPKARARSVHISLPRCADPGGKKGGSLPSSSKCPDRHGRAASWTATATGTAG